MGPVISPAITQRTAACPVVLEPDRATPGAFTEELQRLRLLTKPMLEEQEEEQEEERSLFDVLWLDATDLAM